MAETPRLAREPQLDEMARSRSDRRLAIFRNLRRDPGTVLGFVIVFGTIIVALLAPWLPIQDPTDLDLGNRLLSPSQEFP